MIWLAASLLIFAVTDAIIASVMHDPALYVVSASAIAAAVATFRAARISVYLRALVALFSIETLVVGIANAMIETKTWPTSLSAINAPATTVITVACLSFVMYLSFKLPVVRKMMVITDRYFGAADPVRIRLPWRLGFVMKEAHVAIVLMMIVLVILQINVVITVLLSYASRAMANALQAYDAPGFWWVITVTLPICILPWLFIGTIQDVAANTLVIRWRQWLTGDYDRRWMESNAHYAMMLRGVGTDNPDQRIQEDVPRFIDGGGRSNMGTGIGVQSLCTDVIFYVSSFISFSVVLWGLSASFTIPGTLVWVTIGYAMLVTGMSHLVGRPLAALSFAHQHYEANFRFSLSRRREYSEQIALLKGEKAELAIAQHGFRAIRKNFFSLLWVKLVLTTTQSVFAQFSYYIPYILLGSIYLMHRTTYGDLVQTAAAFAAVYNSVNFFVTFYISLAEFKSVLARLTTFDAALEEARMPPRGERSDSGDDFVLSNVEVRLPDETLLSAPIDLRLRKGENTLFVGPSGTGKSTLFRVLVGVWPYWDGRIDAPRDGAVLVLPQKPYVPMGTLAAALSYPAQVGAYDTDAINAALQDVGLAHLSSSLEIHDGWGQRLSGGELQRLAVARALLLQPAWLFLDEATSAMDVELEDAIYAIIGERLPATTLVSITHRAGVARHHPRLVSIAATPQGRFVLTDGKATLSRKNDRDLSIGGTLGIA